MPIVEQSGLNWAKEIDENDTEIEYNEESGIKNVIEYKFENNKKYKITSVYRIEKVKVPKSVAERKAWTKFGDSQDDPPGINPATTVIADEVFMQFLSSKDETEKQETTTAAALASIKCRICKGDHWSAKCPHKDLFTDKMVETSAKESQATTTSSGGAYKPPSMRAGASQASMGGKKMDYKSSGGKDDFTVRVSNLPEEATEHDLQELFKPFGKVSRVFLAKDKSKQVSRGFAYVTFFSYDDAQRAIWTVNGYGYNHLILKVEWAKPSKDSQA